MTSDRVNIVYTRSYRATGQKSHKDIIYKGHSKCIFCKSVFIASGGPSLILYKGPV